MLIVTLGHESHCPMVSGEAEIIKTNNRVVKKRGGGHELVL